jgi:ATP dependent DNA ligase domain
MDLRSIELMLATNAKPFSREGWIFEFKYDGYRVLATKEQLLTPNRKDATTWYPEIVQALGKLRGSFVIDGEVCLVDADGIPNFEAMRVGNANARDLLGPPATTANNSDMSKRSDERRLRLHPFVRLADSMQDING